MSQAYRGPDTYHPTSGRNSSNPLSPVIDVSLLQGTTFSWARFHKQGVPTVRYPKVYAAKLVGIACLSNSLASYDIGCRKIVPAAPLALEFRHDMPTVKSDFLRLPSPGETQARDTPAC